MCVCVCKVQIQVNDLDIFNEVTNVIDTRSRLEHLEQSHSLLLDLLVEVDELFVVESDELVQQTQRRSSRYLRVISRGVSTSPS